MQDPYTAQWCGKIFLKFLDGRMTFKKCQTHQPFIFRVYWNFSKQDKKSFFPNAIFCNEKCFLVNLCTRVAFLENKPKIIFCFPGLDPASPLFKHHLLREPSTKLDATKADFVDIIHTDGSPVFTDGFGLLRFEQ